MTGQPAPCSRCGKGPRTFPTGECEPCVNRPMDPEKVMSGDRCECGGVVLHVGTCSYWGLTPTLKAEYIRQQVTQGRPRLQQPNAGDPEVPAWRHRQ